MGYTEKFADQVKGSLRPGERVLAALRAQPPGSTLAMGIGGLAGAAVASKMAKNAKEAGAAGAMASAWPNGQCGVGLTDQRLILFNFSMMGKAKDLVAEYPIEQVTSIEQEKKKITDAVRFSFADGSAIQVEVKKLEKTEEFTGAFGTTKRG